MTTYRLLNDIFTCKESFTEYYDLKDQLPGLKVGFNEKTDSLIDKIEGKWTPPAVTFEKSEKGNRIPHICTWNMSCLIMNENANVSLENLIGAFGEFLALDQQFFLYHSTTSIDGSALNEKASSFDAGDYMRPKKLALIEDKVKGLPLFKPGFAHNSFLICSDEFKKACEENALKGLLFESNLAQIFPQKN